MDESLQRLLDAELRAEEIARKADEEREGLIRKAMDETKLQEQRFEARIPEIHADFIGKAETHAEQTVSELKRRYQEHHAHLREQAQTREDDALEAAFQLLIDPKAG